MPAFKPSVGARSRRIEEFYRHFYPLLVQRVQWRFRLSREDARDIVQDAFAIALVKLDISTDPNAWLTRVVDFLAANMCRKSKRRAALLLRWSYGPGRLMVEREDILDG